MDEQLEIQWSRLKNKTEDEIGCLNISPPSDLPWTIHTLVQKMAELERHVDILIQEMYK